MSDIHVGDVGTVFTLTVTDGSAAVDISSATVKQMSFRKPDRTVVAKDAVFSTAGTDGKLKYTAVAGDFDQDGHWLLQAYVEIDAGDFHSDVIHFNVLANLE